MESNSKLKELKQKIRDTSNQQQQIQGQRDSIKEIVSYREREQEQNQQEIMQLVKNVFGQSEIMAAKERELLQDKLDKFLHRQTVMNEQLIILNDNLTNTTALKSVYDAKREELELDYKNQKDTLQRQINSIEKQLKSKKIDLEHLEKEISTKISKLEEITIDTKKATFWNELKKTWVDKWLVYVIVGFFALIIGGFAGWGIFTLIGNIFSSICKFIGLIFK